MYIIQLRLDVKAIKEVPFSAFYIFWTILMNSMGIWKDRSFRCDLNFFKL